MKLAQSMESAQASSTQLQGSDTSSGTSDMNSGMNYASGYRKQTLDKQDSRRGKPCHRCGGEHFPSNCRFKEVTCNKCHKKGHLARVCRTVPQSHTTGRTTGR